jgi:AcrR family transcriptional regulator
VIHFFLQMAYRPTEKTEARKAATRERIVAAALDQVAEGGYASAGVQSVAARAGVAVGTVYRHFPSKAELFAEVFRRASQRELDVMSDLAAARADERPASERIAAAAEVFCRRALAGPVLAYALLAEPVDPAVEAERLRFRRGYRDMFARALRQGVEDGEIAPHDPEVLGAAITGGLGEALVGPLAARRRSEALVASLVQFCLDAIPIKQRERSLAA